LNQVASVADAVDDIALGTANGPTRFGPLLRVISAASTIVRADVRGLEARILDRLLHRDVIPRRAFTQKPHGTSVDHIDRIERRRALNLRTEAKFRILFSARDAGLRLVETRKHFLSVVSDGRDNAHPRDHNSPHDPSPLVAAL
jgi:hypothetical protein